jgi:hypothetical protein
MTSPTDGGSSIEYPYAQRDVYDALVAAVNSMWTMKLVSDDESTGSVIVKPVGSLLSWSRNVSFSVVATAAGTSRVSAEAPPSRKGLLGLTYDPGQYYRNVGAIHDALSSELRSHPPIHASSQSEESARLAELQSFLDRGFISPEEFDRWSGALRGGR